MIYSFNYKETLPVSLVGGKGKALIETLNAGLPVPDGFVMSVEFFEPWMNELKNSAEWSRMLENTTKDNCVKLQSLIDDIIRTTSYMESFEKSLVKLNGNVFAVRSSSPEEDLDDSSFAGMYETLLGVKKADVFNAVKEIFKSCFDFKVMAYKKTNRLNIENTNIAVIVQTQIHSDVSGVGFSINPINNAYDEVFINASFIEKHGARTFKEIDIASPRSYENLIELYTRLKEINIDESQIQKVAEKKKKAYSKLLGIAKENGFTKKFEKQAEIFESTFGYREYMKYSTVNFIAHLRRIVLLIAEEFVQAGRLDDESQVFDLHISDIVKAQKDTHFDLRKQREKNLIPYKKTEKIKDWPIMFDSRGKIYRPKLEIKDGDYVGTSISPGTYIGKAKVLNSPYEKSLEPGEILVTKSTEPSWTPIFINASAVVMEVGGPLQHGGIIAREYGIPCVSGLIGIMDIINDGDLLEVDGSNGVVKFIEKSK